MDTYKKFVVLTLIIIHLYLIGFAMYFLTGWEWCITIAIVASCFESGFNTLTNVVERRIIKEKES